MFVYIILCTCTAVILNVQGQQTCRLPPYPKNGHYTVKENSTFHPGDSVPGFIAHITCDPGYQLVGDENITCLGGSLSYDALPECVQYCNKTDSNIILFEPSNKEEFKCLLNTADSSFSARSSSEDEDCGVREPINDKVAGGRDAKQFELPWHVGIYSKNGEVYKQVCGGTIVRLNVVISAAHCFWDETNRKPYPAEKYAIGAGKIYRAWDNPEDEHAQKSDVLSIHIPPRYQATLTNYQDDLAVLVIKSAFQYTKAVRPACLDFDEDNDEEQLINGVLGEVQGWGLTGSNGPPSPILKIADIPYVIIEECIETAPQSFLQFITSDKICAGYKNGTALCRGDSGGGINFPQEKDGITRYYVRGVLSTAPTSEYDACNICTWAAYTYVIKHKRFINKILKMAAEAVPRT